MHGCDAAVGVARAAAMRERARTILLVDDDPEVREVLGEFLSMRGYLVEACANGADALAYLRTAPPPRIILLDVQMPIMDGYEFRAAQTRDAALAAIPVVVISDQTTLDRARLGGVEVLPKPFKGERLLDVIEQRRRDREPPFTELGRRR